MNARQINDGGPAFPSSPTVGPNNTIYRPVDIGCEGMSLRDHFAGLAVVALISEPHWPGNNQCAAGLWQKSLDGPAMYAAAAYDLADAMLAARTV